ncbi:MAG: hypothetical protein DMG96_15160 [Acidobacteria bacterium]|nr:MAG: hypothetical protein DMG96_15160 [Acidobacteriota bacterium]
MKPLHKGFLIAVLQLVIVSSLGVKLLYDRAHRPRIWIKSAVYDPNLPIRGKYLSLSIEVPAESFTEQPHAQPYYGVSFSPYRCDLVLRSDHLVAVGNERGEFFANVQRRDNSLLAVINGETAYFLPEHKNGPILCNRGEELWIEATIPRKGPPRPIRLGIKKNGVLTPLSAD